MLGKTERNGEEREGGERNKWEEKGRRKDEGAPSDLGHGLRSCSNQIQADDLTMLRVFRPKSNSRSLLVVLI